MLRDTRSRVNDGVYGYADRGARAGIGDWGSLLGFAVLTPTYSYCSALASLWRAGAALRQPRRAVLQFWNRVASMITASAPVGFCVGP